MGVEACVLPTAVLSTHTSFKDFTFRDLTDDIEPIRECWEKSKIEFDGIYTEHLGSKRQIDLVLDMLGLTGNVGDFIKFGISTYNDKK